MERSPYTITKIERHAEHQWTARVNGVPVDRHYGSWRITPDPMENGYTECSTSVSAALAAKVRPLERAEAKAAVA